jgi:hypothetical protein
MGLFLYVLLLQGHRLGTANENFARPSSGVSNAQSTELPQPILDSNLTDADREKIRADRAAAAEARLKKQALPKSKKKATANDAPLRGPNSTPTMTWTAG